MSKPVLVAVAVLAALVLFGLAGVFMPTPAAALVISEFAADNDTIIADDDGDFSDWLEIHNDSGVGMDLAGYYLSDNASDLPKWQFPSITIVAGGYLLVWASDKDRTDPAFALHANFKLSKGGEYLALVQPDGVTVEHEYSPLFPPQLADQSYGLSVDLTTERCFVDPTPGAQNDESTPCGPVLTGVDFSVERGFFDAQFDVELTTPSPGATIRYTLDGSAPSHVDGTVYAGPISITTTSMLRAVASAPSFQNSIVTTNTYIFLDDVLQQSIDTIPPEYPAKWGGGKTADYDMDPEVVNDPLYASTIKDDLKSIRTMSIVMDIDDLFDKENGFYQHPQGRGVKWERPASMEVIIPDGSEGFHINCGIRVQGGLSRSPGVKKHSLRLLFKSIYGPAKLEYPLFDEGSVERFDTIVLTAGHGNAWTGGFSKAQYLRDTWLKDIQLATGQPGLRSTHVHLYLNGMYWGLYRPTERPDASYMAEHLGGDKEDYDALNDGRPNDGDRIAWETTQALADAGLDDPINYAALLEYVDVDNLIDYMMINFYAGNADWDFHNWRGSRLRQAGAGWKFFSWDAEEIMGTPFGNRTGSNNIDKPSSIYDNLRKENPEFQLLFADHAHRHLFNDGVMTPDRASELFMRRSKEIDRAIVGESARWGDKSRAQPFTRDKEWLIERQRLLHTWLPIRTEVLVRQLRDKGLYPAHAAPVFNQHGGDFSPGFMLTMTAANGQILYTDDGSDPRLPGGAVSATAQPYTGPVPLTGSVQIKARAQVGMEWSALNEAQFVNETELRVTEVMYNPTLGDGLEFLELANVGANPIQLAGIKLTDGVNFTFTPMVLAPGGHVLVIEDAAAFEAHYGTGLPVVGVYSGRLSNGGERVALEDADGNLILAFTYDDAWYPSSDGGGPSLVIRDASADKNFWDVAEGWRPSTFDDGSAGAAELPLCSDSADNDGDGDTDYPADDGCASAASDIEDPACDDATDNDADGLIDLGDPDCSNATDTLEGPEPINAFVCYQARTSRGTPKLEHVDVALDDVFEGPQQYLVRRTKAVCVPSNVNKTDIVDSTTYLQSYDIRGTAGVPVGLEGFPSMDDLGPLNVDVKRAERLLVPASLDTSVPPSPPANGSHAVDHYKCYRSRITKGSPKYFPSGAHVQASNLFEERDFKVKPPKHVCAPVDVDGTLIKNPVGYLLCYSAKRGKFAARHSPLLGLLTSTAIADEQIDTRREEEICLPARLIGVP